MVNKERLEQVYYSLWQIVNDSGEVILFFDRLPEKSIISLMKERKGDFVITKTTVEIVAEVHNKKERT